MFHPSVDTHTHTHIYLPLSVTPASLCCSCHSVFTLWTPNLLLDWRCSLGPSVPLHSRTHTNTHTRTCMHTHTHARTRSYKNRYHTQSHGHTGQLPATWFPARGRLLHLSLSNLSPLAQQQLAPISSPMGLGFIKETVMSTAACSRLTNSPHRWQVTVWSNGMWLSGQRNGLKCGLDKLLLLFLKDIEFVQIHTYHTKPTPLNHALRKTMVFGLKGLGIIKVTLFNFWFHKIIFFRSGSVKHHWTEIYSFVEQLAEKFIRYKQD